MNIKINRINKNIKSMNDRVTILTSEIKSLNNKKVIKKRSNIIKNVIKKLSNIISFIQKNILLLKNNILRLFKVNIYEKAIKKSSLVTIKGILAQLLAVIIIIIVFINSPLEFAFKDLSQSPSEIPYEEFFEYPLEIPIDPTEVPIEGFFEYPLEISLEPIKKYFLLTKLWICTYLEIILLMNPL